MPEFTNSDSHKNPSDSGHSSEIKSSGHQRRRNPIMARKRKTTPRIHSDGEIGPCEVMEEPGTCDCVSNCMCSKKYSKYSTEVMGGAHPRGNSKRPASAKGSDGIVKRRRQDHMGPMKMLIQKLIGILFPSKTFPALESPEEDHHPRHKQSQRSNESGEHKRTYGHRRPRDREQ